MLARPEPIPLRLNVGCGTSPTPGWVNIDNSPTVRLGGLPWLWPILPRAQREFARRARAAGIRAGSATRMPLPDNSADVLYSSHMMEHLDHAEALGFLREAYRVLRPGGVIRLVMPDLRKIAQDYMANGDADAFVRDTLMFTDRPRTLLAWLRHIITGPRHHLWMYDGRSLVRHLTEAGFLGAAQLAPGKTNIIEPGALSLSERAAESVFVEAVKPRA